MSVQDKEPTFSQQLALQYLMRVLKTGETDFNKIFGRITRKIQANAPNDTKEPIIICLLTEIPRNTLGDVAASSKLIKLLKANFGTSFKFYAIFREDYANLQAKDLGPQKLEEEYDTYDYKLLMLRTWESLATEEAQKVLKKSDVIVTFPRPETLRPYMELLPDNIPYVEVNEYNFGTAEKTGIGRNALGIFINDKIQTQAISKEEFCTLPEIDKPVTEKLLNPDKTKNTSLCFGYFHRDSNMVRGLIDRLPFIKQCIEYWINCKKDNDKAKLDIVTKLDHTNIEELKKLKLPETCKELKIKCEIYTRANLDNPEIIFLGDKRKSATRTIRIFSCFPYSHQTFKAFLRRADLISVTGDQSFSEALACGKPIFYQIMNWKVNLARAFVELVKTICGKHSPTYEFYSLQLSTATKSETLTEILCRHYDDICQDMIKIHAELVENHNILKKLPAYIMLQMITHADSLNENKVRTLKHLQSSISNDFFLCRLPTDEVKSNLLKFLLERKLLRTYKPNSFDEKNSATLQSILKKDLLIKILKDKTSFGDTANRALANLISIFPQHTNSIIKHLFNKGDDVIEETVFNNNKIVRGWIWLIIKNLDKTSEEKQMLLQHILNNASIAKQLFANGCWARIIIDSCDDDFKNKIMQLMFSNAEIAENCFCDGAHIMTLLDAYRKIDRILILEYIFKSYQKFEACFQNLDTLATFLLLHYLNSDKTELFRYKRILVNRKRIIATNDSFTDIFASKDRSFFTTELKIKTVKHILTRDKTALEFIAKAYDSKTDTIPNDIDTENRLLDFIFKKADIALEIFKDGENLVAFLRRCSNENTRKTIITNILENIQLCKQCFDTCKNIARIIQLYNFENKMQKQIIDIIIKNQIITANSFHDSDISLILGQYTDDMISRIKIINYVLENKDVAQAVLNSPSSLLLITAYTHNKSKEHEVLEYVLNNQELSKLCFLYCDETYAVLKYSARGIRNQILQFMVNNIKTSMKNSCSTTTICKIIKITPIKFRNKLLNNIISSKEHSKEMFRSGHRTAKLIAQYKHDQAMQDKILRYILNNERVAKKCFDCHTNKILTLSSNSMQSKIKNYIANNLCHESKGNATGHSQSYRARLR